MKIFHDETEDLEEKGLKCIVHSDEIEDKFQRYEAETKKTDINEFQQRMSELFHQDPDVESFPVENSMENLNCREVECFSAEEINLWFKEKVDPDYNNPYAEETEVKLIELMEDTRFSRVYAGDVHGIGMYGTWMMKTEDLKGLSPEQVKEKYALPELPTNIVDVEVKAGTRLRMGVAGSVENWGSGGGIQFDTVGKRLDKKCFKNARTLEEDS